MYKSTLPGGQPSKLYSGNADALRVWPGYPYSCLDRIIIDNIWLNTFKKNCPHRK